MRYLLDMKIDNDAFATDHPARFDASEIARILRDTADKIDGSTLAHGDMVNLRDINGNTVGSWAVVLRDVSEG